MLRLDVHGLTVELNIKGYKKTNRDMCDSDWCKCDFAFRFADIIDYHKLDDEVFLSAEVVEIEEKLTMLLNDELHEITEIICIEPNFIFVLHPKRDLREDPKYTYVQAGYEIEDIFVEWKIYFWNRRKFEFFGLCMELRESQNTDRSRGIKSLLTQN